MHYSIIANYRCIKGHEMMHASGSFQYVTSLYMIYFNNQRPLHKRFYFTTNSTNSSRYWIAH